MDYPDISKKDNLKKLFKKKEFIQYKHKIKKKQAVNVDIDTDIKNNNILLLHSYQHFIKNLLNPNTPYNSILLKWEVGIGKTIAALAVAMDFIDYIENRRLNGGCKGYVFIIGFTKNIFQEDLIKFPHFGYVSIEETKILKKYKDLSLKNPKYMDEYKKIRTIIKKRLVSNKNRGYFKFYGYKEVANKLFIYDPLKIDIFKLSISEILDNIKIKLISLNLSFLESFNESLIICDEIHKVYNSTNKNNWGTALILIMRISRFTKNIFLTATPMMNNATEIFEIISLLDQGYSKRDYKIQKKTFFDENGNLIPKAKNDFISLLKIKLRGKISFLRDANPDLFPTKEIMGEKILGIQFLKFVRCKMSPFHEKTYNYALKNSIINEMLYLHDICLPNPLDESIGLYKNKDIRNLILSADTQWKKANKVDIVNDNVIGDLMMYDNIKKYSSKYHKFLTIVFDIIRNKKGKIFVYHKYKQISGINFIKAMLIANGLVFYGEKPVSKSICYYCHQEQSKHKVEKHIFKPIVFIDAHGDYNRDELQNKINIFNSEINIHGEEIFFLIGSRVMEESYTLKNCRHVMIMQWPENISTLIQIIGRAVRKNSHALLPLELRTVSIYIFVSSYNEDKLTYEESTYLNKMNNYINIRNVEEILHKLSIDFYINEDIIFPTGKKSDMRIKVFEPYEEINDKIGVIPDLTTFQGYYADEEVNFIKILIKRMFLQISYYWTYDDLWKTIRNPPFPSFRDLQYMSELDFIFSLNQLVWNETEEYENIIVPFKKENYIFDLFDPDQKFIYLPNNHTRYVIVQKDIFYILVPFNDKKKSPIIDVDIPFRNITSIRKNQIKLNNHITKMMDNKNIDNIIIIFRDSFNKFDINLLSKYKEYINEYLFEFLISYFYNLFTGTRKKHKYHKTLVKLLIYLDLIGLIFWVSTVPLKNQKIYADITQKTFFLEPFYKKIFLKIYEDLGYKIDKLESTNKYIYLHKLLNNYVILTSSYLEKVVFVESQIDSWINKKKIPVDLLPIGYFFDSVVKFYHKGFWKIDSLLNIQYKKPNENDNIVGIESVDKNFNFKFKLRQAIQKTKQKDMRLLQKGMICEFKDKENLKKQFGFLSLKPKKKLNIKNSCELIKNKLLIEEYKDKNTKYFYSLFEKEFI